MSGSSSFTQYKNTDPNVTLTIHAGHSSHGSYYCIVKYNGATIGRGHTIISVKGIDLGSNCLIVKSHYRIVTVFQCSISV